MHWIASFPETRRERRRQSRWRTALATGAAASLVATAIAGYQVGLTQAQIEIARLQADLALQHELGRQLGERAASAEQEAEAAVARHAQLMQRQRAEALAPELRRLTELAEARLRDGVPAARLELLIAAAGVPPVCEPQVESRRLTVHTSTGTAPITSASFFSDRVIVTGEGNSTRSADGRPGGGFDPAQPVRLRFLEIGGEVTSASGQVPLTHAMALDGEELRFAVRVSERDPMALEISAQRCRLP